MPANLANFLKRVVLDTSFRKLATSDLISAAAEYELDEPDLAILAAGDERMLAMLGKALLETWGEAFEPSNNTATDSRSSESSNEATTSIQSLPQFKLRLRLTPHGMTSPDGNVTVSHAASLYPWTDEPPPFEGVDQGGGQMSPPMPGIDMMLSVHPSIVPQSNGATAITYSAAVHHPSFPSSQSNEQTADSANSSGGRNYHSSSAAAIAAAKQVRAASQDERFEAILKLVNTLRHGDERTTADPQEKEGDHA